MNDNYMQDFILTIPVAVVLLIENPNGFVCTHNDLQRTLHTTSTLLRINAST